jgi:hypothetical protein
MIYELDLFRELDHQQQEIIKLFHQIHILFTLQKKRTFSSLKHDSFNSGGPKLPFLFSRADFSFISAKVKPQSKKRSENF